MLPNNSQQPRLTAEATRQEWRLLMTPPASGAWNMAVDEAIAIAHGQGLVPPTLRLYAWSPPALSLGYFQPLAEVDEQACAEAGVDVVRRLTGGRAILHDEELTYSVVLQEAWLPGSVSETYRVLATGLVRGLRRLGGGIVLQPEHPRHTSVGQGTGQGRRHVSDSAACFDRPASFEVTAQGRKLAGSAQTRRHGCILQHGSVPLRFDPAAIFGLLRLGSAEQERLARLLSSRAISLSEALGREMGWHEAATALAAGWQEQFGLQMNEGNLTQTETEQAEALMASRYNYRDWTARH